MEKQTNQNSNKIFGTHVSNTRCVPGYTEATDENSKKKQEELFEIVDDYVEQA